MKALALRKQQSPVANPIFAPLTLKPNQRTESQNIINAALSGTNGIRADGLRLRDEWCREGERGVTVSQSHPPLH